MKKIFSNSIFITLLFYILIYAQTDAIWEATNGPETGNVNCFAVNSSGQIFAGTDQGYIYRSDDDGASWLILNSSGAPKYIDVIMIPDGTTIYASSENTGLYKSVDNGLTWNIISGLSGIISALGKTANGDILVGTRYGSGIFKSSDGGQSWTPVNTGFVELTSQHHIKGFALSSTGSVFVCGIDTAIYKSDDNGDTWSAFGKLTTTSDFKGILCTENSNLLLATLGDGVYRSPINSPSWSQVNTNLSNLSLYTLTSSQTGSDVFCGCTQGDIFKSVNEGDSWTEVDGDISNQTVQAILAFNNTILKGSDGEGIFGSTDNGTTWQTYNDGFNNSRVNDIEISQSGALFTGTQDMVYVSTDDGNQWTRKSSGLPYNYVNDLLINKNNSSIFAATRGIARSLDNGETWSLLTNGISSSAIFYSIAINENNGLIFAASMGSGMYRSDDGGDNWSEINSGLTYGSTTYLRDISFDSNGTIYIAAYDYSNPKGIFKSINNGDTWTQITVNDGQNDLNTKCIAINNENVIFTGTSGVGIFRSSNNGDTWETVSNGLSNLFINKITINSLGHIFAGTNAGIYRSFNNGESWNFFNEGIADSYILSLRIDDQDYLYAGTRSTGVYKTTKKTTVPTPALVAPTNNDQARPTNLNLSWQSIPEATEYQLQVSVNPDFSINFIDETGITEAYKSVTNLNHDTKYFWRVRAWNGYACSNWSEIYIFTTFKEGPSLLLPANNAIDVDPKVSFSWHAISGVDGYNLQVSFNEGFSTIDYELTNITSNEATIADMGYAKTYYWRVQAVFPEGASDWSELYTFKTIRSGPVLILPNDNDDAMSVYADFTWNSVPNATSYQIQISSNAQFTSLDYDVDNITVTQHTETSLLHGQQYYWRVRAHFSDGSSAWSDVWTFTTLKTGPELRNPADNQIGVNNTVDFSWITVASATEYHLQVSTDISFDSPEYDKNQIAATSYQITNLSNSNTYFWHVRAIFSDGSFTDWSEIRSFRTILVPIDLISPENNTTDVTFPVTFSWNGTQYATSYWLQLSTEDDFDPIVIDDNTISLTSYQVTSLDFNTQYFWRVAAMDNGAAGEWSTIWSFNTQEYPNSINANTTIQFPTYNEPRDYQATDYRLFGLPGNSELSFDQLFDAGSAGKKWIAYYDEYDQINSSNIFIKFVPLDERFKFSQGRGFWVLNKGQLGVNLEVASAILNDQNQAHITLHNGWNIITNPFPFNVSWQAVCDLNELGSIPLYSYNGSFNTSTMLEPYKGYYIDNNFGKSDIFVPYIESMGKLAVSINKLDWCLDITLNSGKFIDASTWLGISNIAKTEIDELDYRKPCAIGSVPRVYFNHSDWGEKWASMASDIRPEIENKEIWNFDVDAPAGQKARLTFTDIKSIPANYEAYLVDRSKLRSINLRLENDYSFTPVTDHSKFAIIIGNETAVEEELQLIVPREFMLGSNYPNPFNPETIIPIELAEANKISIKIYNILGEEVRTLFHGTLETGRHQFTWDGTNQAGQRCPSGIYLYHVDSDNGIKATKRMVLMK